MSYGSGYSKRGVTTTETSVVPESYRPLILACVGIWGWTIVLSILHWQRIDVNVLLHTTACRVQSLLCLATSLTLSIICHITIMEHTIFIQHTNIFNHIGPVVLCYAVATALILAGPCKKECHQFLKFVPLNINTLHITHISL